MSKNSYWVETIATVRRRYLVLANDEKDAATTSCDLPPDSEEEVNEEIVSITADAPTQEPTNG